MALVPTVVTPSQVAAASGVATSTTSFSPSTGALVVVLFTYMYSTNATGVTFTVADNHSNTYTLSFTPLNNGGSGAEYVGMATFTYGSAPGSTTVHVTASSTGTADCLITPIWFTGQAASQSGAAFASNTNGSSGTTIQQTITPTTFGSFVVIAGGAAAVTVSSTAIAGTTLGSSWSDSGVGNSANSGITSGISMGGQINVGFTTSGTTTFGYSIAALEILPAVTQPWPLQAVQGSTNTSSPLALTLPLATSPGSTLIVCANGNASTNNPSVTGVTLGGAAGNFAQVLTAGVVSSDFQTVSVWADPNCTSGQTAVSVAFSFSGTLGALTATVLEVPGLLTTAPNSDKTVSAVQNTNTTSWSSGATATTSQAAEFAVGTVGAYLSTGVGAINGPAAPWVNLPQKNSPGASIGQLTGFQPLTTAQAITYSGTTANSNQYTAVVATFKAAAGTSAAPQIVRQAVKRAAYY